MGAVRVLIRSSFGTGRNGGMARKSVLWALGILSAATLALEINLTRLFAVAQFYHFSFMIVSLALLGFGASGTLLALLPRLQARAPVRALAWTGWGFAGTAIGAYLLTLYLPFDSFRIALDAGQWGVLALHYVALSTPFMCSGLAVGLLLAVYPERSNRIYAANMIGSGMGCLLAVILPTLVGGESVVLLAGALGVASAGVCTWTAGGRRQLSGDGVSTWTLHRGQPLRRLGRIAHLAVILLLSLAAFRLPAWLGIVLSPYKSLSYALLYPDAEHIFQRWNSISRVDVVRSSSIRSLPGSGYICAHAPPAQLGLTVDGDGLTPISHVPPGFSDLPFSDCLLTALPYQLHPGAHTLILEPGGGFDVLVALAQGAGQVTAVVDNPLVVQAVRQQGAWAGDVYDDPRVRVVAQEGRSYVKQAPERYEVIDLALTEPQRTVVSGAYSLAEDYDYTVEAFVDLIDRLDQDGLLVVSRWLQVPPSESIRAFALAVEAVARTGGSPRTNLVALRSYQQMLILARRTAFTDDELRAIRRFAEERRFDPVYLPDLQPGEVNRYNVLPEPMYSDACMALVQASERGPAGGRTWYEAYAFDVRPPTDDRPFFAHFFKWRQLPEVLAAAGHTWQPFGGAGYLVPLALLGLASLCAGAIILLPLALRQGSTLPRRGGWRVLAYFALLGLGYLSIEIPLMQRFILFLGHPTWSLSTVLFGILVFSGIGSRFSPHVPLRAVLLAIPALVGGYALGLPYVFEWTLALPLWGRLLVSMAALAPLGLLMGMPFPSGVTAIRSGWIDTQPGVASPQASSHIAWAWAVNGALSVIASILAALIALSWGFLTVLVLGAGCYLVALAMRPVGNVKRQA
jgi:spermidine synthase